MANEENVNQPDGEEINEATQAEAVEPDKAQEEPTAQAHAEGEEVLDPLEEAMNTIAQLEDKLARANADYYNLQQEYNSYVRRSKSEAAARKEEGKYAVLEALIPVLDDIALAQQHDDLEGPAGQIAQKIEQTLQVNYQLERFGGEGDAFDPSIHEALMHTTSPDVESEQVNVLIQPGYKAGEKLLRPARVGVVSPE